MQWLATKFGINNNNLENTELQDINGYTILKELGRGSFGIVYLVEKSGKQYAMKSIKFQDEKDEFYYNNEKNILKKLPENESLVHYIDDFKLLEDNFIVMEFIEGENLRRYLQGNIEITIRQITEWLLQSLEVINIFHTMNIVHRDIKPENLIIKKEDKNRIVFIDYGGIGIVADDDEIMISRIGTKAYRPYVDGIYGKEVDISALAIKLLQHLKTSPNSEVSNSLSKQIVLIWAHFYQSTKLGDQKVLTWLKECRDAQFLNEIILIKLIHSAKPYLLINSINFELYAKIIMKITLRIDQLMELFLNVPALINLLGVFQVCSKAILGDRPFLQYGVKTRDSEFLCAFCHFSRLKKNNGDHDYYPIMKQRNVCSNTQFSPASPSFLQPLVYFPPNYQSNSSALQIVDNCKFYSNSPGQEVNYISDHSWEIINSPSFSKENYRFYRIQDCGFPYKFKARPNVDILFYFEVKLIKALPNEFKDDGLQAPIFIGLSAFQHYHASEPVGKQTAELGYGSNGSLCNGPVISNPPILNYGPKYGMNDRIGCGLLVNGSIFFTCNGLLLPEVIAPIVWNGSTRLYSSLSTKGSIKCKFYYEKEDFLFNPPASLTLSYIESKLANKTFAKIIQTKLEQDWQKYVSTDEKLLSLSYSLFKIIFSNIGVQNKCLIPFD